MYDAYKDRVAFYVIYISEAHPTDLWQMQSNVRDGVLFASTHTDQDRTATASACVRKLGIRIPALIDHAANATEQDYTGWPDRLYLIGQDGLVKFKSAPGPFGFVPKDLEQALHLLFP